jgi:DNA-binding GntR family transcriptional regulator
MTTRAAEPRTTANLTDHVYLRIREDIVNGVLRPNEALVEADLAERLQVSRTPIRESLQRLAADGLINSHRRRWIVHEYTFDEIVQLYEVRAALESYAAGLAALRGTKEQKAAIEEFRAQAIATDLTPMGRMESNSRFHHLVVEAANNPLIADLLARNELYHFNVRVATLYTTEEIAISARQHAETIDAVIAGDARRAADVAREHVEFSLSIIARGFKEQGGVSTTDRFLALNSWA